MDLREVLHWYNHAGTVFVVATLCGCVAAVLVRQIFKPGGHAKDILRWIVVIAVCGAPALFVTVNGVPCDRAWLSVVTVCIGLGILGAAAYGNTFQEAATMPTAVIVVVVMLLGNFAIDHLTERKSLTENAPTTANK